MGIRRYIPKPSTLKYDGVLIGLRSPNVDQMKVITEIRQRYMQTVRAAGVEENANPSGVALEGNLLILTQAKEYVAVNLCCDPEKPSDLWFAKDEAEQKKLKLEGVEKDIVTDVPDAFLDLVFRVFTLASNSAGAVDFAAVQDKNNTEDPPVEDGEKTPTDPTADVTLVPSQENTTTTLSANSASTLGTISRSTQSELSENGGTPNS